VDLWSCGVIFYACAYGHLPFEANLELERDPVTGTICWTQNNVYQLYCHVASNRIELPDTASLGLAGQDLLTRLLDPDPITRVGFPEIWSHAWFSPLGKDSKKGI
jgi:serine/threonine protein kinase